MRSTLKVSDCESVQFCLFSTFFFFLGPYNRVVTEYFNLSNPTEQSIAFKVKTTAPKRYCVRPNNGTIKPGGSVSVAVMLQPLTGTDTMANIDKSKHKFMIQSVFAPNNDANSNADDLVC